MVCKFGTVAIGLIAPQPFPVALGFSCGLVVVSDVLAAGFSCFTEPSLEAVELVTGADPVDETAGRPAGTAGCSRVLSLPAQETFFFHQKRLRTPSLSI